MTREQAKAVIVEMIRDLPAEEAAEAILKSSEDAVAGAVVEIVLSMAKRVAGKTSEFN
jgi:hypothetical protein